MISKLLLQYIMTVSETDIYPRLFDFIADDDTYRLTLPIPLSLDLCKDFVSFFKELDRKNLRDDYDSLLLHKSFSNIYVIEFMRIIKHIQKLHDMLRQLHDICFVIILTTELDEKTRNSFYECCVFFKDYANICELPLDNSKYYSNEQEETMFFLEVLSECFLDIYALEYLVKHERTYYCFRDYIQIIYENQLKSINNTDSWEVMMICEDKPTLMSHIYLPHPDDFRFMIRT
jgi:hypothetical protein